MAVTGVKLYGEFQPEARPDLQLVEPPAELIRVVGSFQRPGLGTENEFPTGPANEVEREVLASAAAAQERLGAWQLDEHSLANGIHRVAVSRSRIASTDEGVAFVGVYDRQVVAGRIAPLSNRFFTKVPFKRSRINRTLRKATSDYETVVRNSDVLPKPDGLVAED